jgi:hypothetical protein
MDRLGYQKNNIEVVMKYNYGDAVLFKELDKKGKVVSKVYASVIWITQVDTKTDSKHFNVPVGSTLYNIEFNDGTVKEFVQGDRLEPYVKDSNSMQK